MLLAGLAGLMAWCAPVVVSADDTQASTASVSFTEASGSVMAIQALPDVDFGRIVGGSQAQALTAPIDGTKAAIDAAAHGPWAMLVQASVIADDAHQPLAGAQLETAAHPTAQVVVKAAGAAPALKTVALYIPAGKPGTTYHAALRWMLFAGPIDAS